jgi:UrcA family protein
MIRIATAALAAIMSTAASANVSAIRIDGESAYVGYGDLDLGSHTGRSQLTGRIHVAASRLCAELRPGVTPLTTTTQCYRVAVQNGVEQMNAITSSKVSN